MCLYAYIYIYLYIYVHCIRTVNIVSYYTVSNIYIYTNTQSSRFSFYSWIAASRLALLTLLEYWNQTPYLQGLCLVVQCAASCLCHTWGYMYVCNVV